MAWTMAWTHRRLARPAASSAGSRTRRAAMVVLSTLISVLIGTSALPSEAAPTVAEYVPELCLRFSDPSPEPGDRLVVDGCAEPGASVAISIGETSIGQTVVGDAGTFRTTVTIPDLDPGSHALVVTAGATELGSLTIDVDLPATEATETDDTETQTATPEPAAEEGGDAAQEGDDTAPDGETPPEQLALSEDEGLSAFWSNVRRFLLVIGAVAVLFGMINSIEANRGRRDNGR